VLSDLLLGDARGAGPDRPSRRSFLVYAGVVALWLLLRAAVLRGRSPEIAFLDNPAASASAFHRILTALAVQLDYLRLLAWPLRQSIDYGYAERRVVESLLDARVLLFLALAAAAIALSFGLRRRAPVVALAVGGYALLFAVSSNLLFPIGSIEAERLAYAPSAFGCLLAGSLLVRLPREILALGLAALTGAFAAKSWNESLAWRDEGTLYRTAVQQASASAKAHLQLGQVLEREGDLDGAARRYEASTSIYGGYGPAWFLYGNLLHRMGRMDEAVRAWSLRRRILPRGRAREPATRCRPRAARRGRGRGAVALRRRPATKLPGPWRLAHAAPESRSSPRAPSPGRGAPAGDWPGRWGCRRHPDVRRARGPPGVRRPRPRRGLAGDRSRGWGAEVRGRRGAAHSLGSIRRSCAAFSVDPGIAGRPSRESARFPASPFRIGGATCSRAAPAAGRILGCAIPGCAIPILARPRVELVQVAWVPPSPVHTRRGSRSRPTCASARGS
jgi:tetratricopeptide (TPR) repeat protein